jgi:hypothetical protein
MRAEIAKEYVEEYGTLTNKQAESFRRRWLDKDTAPLQLRQNYRGMIAAKLGIKLTWCLWCLSRTEIGAIYAEQLKELKKARS